MRQLLDDEEVLSFSFDDFSLNSMSTVIVQAKNLYLYQIDFTRHEVIGKVIDSRHSINMKSIFFNIKPRSKEK